MGMLKGTPIILELCQHVCSVDRTDSVRITRANMGMEQLMDASQGPNCHVTGFLQSKQQNAQVHIVQG